MVYMITYDLNNAGQKYDELFKRIRSISNDHWCHMMDSAWIIHCDKKPSEIFNYLSPAFDKNDYIFIAELSGNYRGQLKKEHSDYIPKLF